MSYSFDKTIALLKKTKIKAKPAKTYKPNPHVPPRESRKRKGRP